MKIINKTKLPHIIEGNCFGNLTVIASRPRSKKRERQWLCLCICGTSIIATESHLKSGRTKSCGCLKREKTKITGLQNATHGATSSKKSSLYPTYISWKGMLSRCHRPSDPFFHRYGGRGITVCGNWKQFETFLNDMGKRPADHTLDRINNAGNYEPSNCRWATAAQQRANQ
jgi:hypothetical protein